MTQEQLLSRARAKMTPVDAAVLRSIVQQWIEVDELYLSNPEGVARLVLRALDALSILHGTEEETAKLDAIYAELREREIAREKNKTTRSGT